MSKPYYSSFFQKWNKVYIRQINPDGTRTNFHVDYKPKLYVKSENPNCEFKTLYGEDLFEIEFKTIESAKEYAKASQDKIFGYPRFDYACVDDQYPYDIEYKYEDLRVVFVDIEVESGTHYSTIKNPDQPVTLIQLLYKDVYYIFGTEFYETFENNVKFIRCKDEEDLLKKFVQVFRKFDPDIISGWNSQGYDIPMLHERMNLIGLGDTFKKLSPFNYIDTSEVLVFGKMQLRVDIKGIQHLDMIELIKKFDRKKYENYKLDTVAKAVLKKGKTSYDGKLSDLYVTDYKRFIEYGLTDVQLVKEIEDAKNLIRMVVMVGYMNKANYIDAFSQVRSWDNQIMIYLKHQDKMQVPYLIAKEDDDFIEAGDEKFEGAYVFHPKTGRWEWVITDDVQSMHPSIIMSFNISPETYLGNSNKNVEFFLKDCTQYTRELIDSNATSLANGAMFDNTYEGFLPKIVRRVFNMRNEAKGEYKKYKKLVEASENSSESLDEIATLKFNQNEVIKYDTLQFALKTSIAAVFGFLGNKYSRFYQLDMAEGITLTSQVMLKSGASEIERVIKEQTDTTEPIMLYGDTDSIRFDSLVYANNDKIQIGDLYNKYNKFIIEDELKQNFVKPVDDVYTLSMNMKSGEIESKKIKYIMKHKVKKKMYRIHHNDTYVDVTQDHSVIVIRDNEYIDVKPEDINTKTDKIIMIGNMIKLETNNFTVECLGEMELDVYDIEVDDNHNFFANDFLVHNSVIYSANSIVEKFVPKNASKENITEFLDRFHKAKIAPALQAKMTEIQTRMNAREHSIRFVRDVISDVSVLVAKKKYIMSVMDAEGVRYAKPDLKLMGIESVKTSTPQFCRDAIEKAIEEILYKTNDDLISYLNNTKSQFMKLPVEDISSPRGINDIEKYTADSIVVDSFSDDEDEESITYKTRTPMHVKASIFHNKLLMEYGLTKWYQPIENGDKIKFTYLKSPNPIGNNAIAFDGKLPEEFNLHKYVDYEMQYEKTFLNAIKGITTVIGWTTEEDAGMF